MIFTSEENHWGAEQGRVWILLWNQFEHDFCFWFTFKDTGRKKQLEVWDFCGSLVGQKPPKNVSAWIQYVLGFKDLVIYHRPLWNPGMTLNHGCQNSDLEAWTPPGFSVLHGRIVTHEVWIVFQLVLSDWCHSIVLLFFFVGFFCTVLIESKLVLWCYHSDNSSQLNS